MTIRITTDTTGQIDVNPRIVKIVCDDTLATITTAGYLNAVISEGSTLLPTDLVLINYANYACGQFRYIASSQTLEPCVSRVIVPTVVNDIAVFNDTHGTVTDASAVTAAAGGLQAGYSGTAGVVTSYPTTAASGKLKLAAVNSSGDYTVTISNASHAQSTVASIPDSGQATTKFVLTDNAGTQHVTTGSLQVDGGNVSAGLAAGGTAGTVISYSATGSKGSLILAAVANTGNTNTTISNAAMGQASVVSIPDPGASTAKFVLDTGTATVVSIANLKYGATPVAQVDPASCTISAAAGAANTATVTIQLKDGSGTNMARSIRFKVYSSSAADGLTLQSAASTGYSVASGGLSLANGTAVTTQIEAMSSATGGCVLSLLDTGKLTSYLVLSLPSGNKISAQLSAGSYG